MPAFGNTPEARIGRSDSKNPATTCKGITNSGRPCRRTLAAPKSGPTGRRNSSATVSGEVFALIAEGDDVFEADFYCWQHKDQAQNQFAIHSRPQQSSTRPTRHRVPTDLFALQERTSIDTLFQSLGLDDPQRPSTNNSAAKPKRSRPDEPNDTVSSTPKPVPQTPIRSKKKTGFWASLCCAIDGEDDYVEIVRHRKRVNQDRPIQAGIPPSHPTATSPPRPQYSFSPVDNRKDTFQDNHQPGTRQLLSLIPSNLPPATISALLAELSKPISPSNEDGYIYIFWLTPQSSRIPAEETARSLLSPERPRHARRISDVMTEYSYDGTQSQTATSRTIMLKIGRANNVTRRMNEWQRQCGYALNLVRWYPHVPRSAAPSPSPSPSKLSRPLYPDLNEPPKARGPSNLIRKVPFVKRVERLIHLELSSKQVKRQCHACGKEHREWFEVEASQAGIRTIDESIKRWVAWSESRAFTST